jgi:GlpG protein
MRMIGQLQGEDQAKRFGAFLYGQGIDNQVDPAREGGWEIWVLDETRIDEAGAHFEQFRQHPDDPTFVEKARTAAVQRQRDKAQETSGRARVIDARTAFYRPPIPYGVVTVSLIGISVAVAVLTKLGNDTRMIQPFAITRYAAVDDTIRWNSELPEIRQGQIWRLFTPMFVHFGILHILFNMWWLWDLGNIIEARRGRWQFLALVLVIAGLSNLAQYAVSGPAFGGMSGVVYGLLCYMWMQGKFNPRSDLSLNPQIVTFMAIWFVLCLTGFVGHVANTAHAAGAGVGAAWGYLAALWATRRH